jgi:AraC-like DNA-binding protein
MLRQARDRIDRDYAEPVGIVALAAEAGYSHSHFIRAFSHNVVLRQQAS